MADIDGALPLAGGQGRPRWCLHPAQAMRACATCVGAGSREPPVTQTLLLPFYRQGSRGCKRLSNNLKVCKYKGVKP